MPKKVFISQPMRNKTPEAIKSERERIIANVKAEYGDDIEIIDSYFEDADLEDIRNKPLAYLAKSIALLATADLAVFAPDWNVARGCILEHTCAVEYYVPVMVCHDI